MADAQDLKSCARKGRAGSTPAPAIFFNHDTNATKGTLPRGVWRPRCLVAAVFGCERCHQRSFICCPASISLSPST